MNLKKFLLEKIIPFIIFVLIVCGVIMGAIQLGVYMINEIGTHLQHPGDYK